MPVIKIQKNAFGQRDFGQIDLMRTSPEHASSGVTHELEVL